MCCVDRLNPPSPCDIRTKAVDRLEADSNDPWMVVDCVYFYAPVDCPRSLAFGGAMQLGPRLAVRTFRSRSRPLVIASGVLLLSGFSGSARADTPSPSESPQPHWSGLPIWGAEAAARGYQLPLPFGIGVTAYSARQPVDIQDLQLGRSPNPPVSVTSFLQINRVDTTQQNVSAKFDVLVFPFFDVYALAGHTTGSTRGLIQVPAVPTLTLTPRQLQLNASFKGPTYGVGATLQGGAKISQSPELTAFAVADINQTKTKLTFSNEQLLAETKPEATVFSARLGLSGVVAPSIRGAMWAGAMHQRIQQEVAGSVANTDLQFLVIQNAAHPWNALLGGLMEFGRNWGILIEGGLGPRMSILAGVGYRF